MLLDLFWLLIFGIKLHSVSLLEQSSLENIVYICAMESQIALELLLVAFHCPLVKLGLSAGILFWVKLKLQFAVLNKIECLFHLYL